MPHDTTPSPYLSTGLDETIDADGWDHIDQRMTEAELDALWVIEMSRRDRERQSAASAAATPPNPRESIGRTGIVIQGPCAGHKCEIIGVVPGVRPAGSDAYAKRGPDHFNVILDDGRMLMIRVNDVSPFKPLPVLKPITTTVRKIDPRAWPEVA